jgi:hypothetical protein
MASEAWRAWYRLVMMFLTFFLALLYYADDHKWPAYVLIGLNGVVLVAVIGYSECNWKGWAIRACAFTCAFAGVSLFYDSPADAHSDSYQIRHSFWHVLTAIGGFLLLTTLPHAPSKHAKATYETLGVTSY